MHLTKLLRPWDFPGKNTRVNPEGNQSWIFIGRSDAETEAPLLWPPDVKNWHWKRLWCWESLKAGKEGDNRGRDGWMASQTQWTWVWTSSRSWWWTEKPGMLQSIGSQRVGHDWATELSWKECLQWVALRLNTSSPFKPSTFSTHFFIWRSCHPHTSAVPLYSSPALYLIFHIVPDSSLPSIPLAITLVHNSVTSSHIS